MQGRDEEAIEVLVALNEKPPEDPFIKNEFHSVKLTVLEMSKGSYRSLFEMSDYREFHRVSLAYINQMFQQISGINLITYYVWPSSLITINLLRLIFSPTGAKTVQENQSIAEQLPQASVGLQRN
jgi:hypothetical protein